MSAENDATESAQGAPERRVIVYAFSRLERAIDDHALIALAALRPHAERIVAVVAAGTAPENIGALRALTDSVLEAPAAEFAPDVYRFALDRQLELDDTDEIVLTGDSWFGPIGDLSAAIDRAARDRAPIRGMVEPPRHLPEAFPDAGYPRRPSAWTWTAIRREVFLSPVLDELWPAAPIAGDGISAERNFFDRAVAAGIPVSYIYPASDFPSTDPALYTPLELIDAGYPFLGTAMFSLFPPLLDRFAIVGRRILDGVVERGYPAAALWQHLARTTPPKALYAIGCALEVLAPPTEPFDGDKPLRVAAVVHVGDIDALPSVLDRLEHLPVPYRLYLTTTDGRRAARLQSIVEQRDDRRRSSFEIRVTPPSGGRDMSDFFVGCRDVLLSGDVDLIVKLHTRRMRRKTDNVQRYFRRYQFENLLDGPGHAAGILAMFQREEGLGFVFPPMMHIGYSTMGRGWAGLKDKARALGAELGIHVPQDSVSPLAPYGGMFFARPEALTLLSAQRWRYRDYGRKGAARYQHLAHLQERMIVSAGAELGYHARTVLTPEHASISHTALESKTDYLFSTTRGWPVEQIALMQRAGSTGHGGVVALARMYVRLNHPRAARVLMPVFDLALRATLTLRFARHGVRSTVFTLLGRPGDLER